MMLDEPMETIAPWDGRRVPVSLIGGYLGSGKTTLINELLARTDRPIAVLVNDVGEVNIDAALIRRRSSDTIELTDGCVCCSLSEGLGAAFDSLRARPEPPDHVLIELSGVADPHRVAPWANSDGFRLDAIVVLVDADQVLERLADRLTEPVIRRQSEAADLFALSKTDLIDASVRASVESALADLAPDTPVIDIGTAGVAGVLDAGTRRPGGPSEVPAPQLFDPHHVELHPLPRPASLDQLNRILDDLPPSVVRAKAIAAGPDEQLLLVQQVGSRRLIVPLPQAEEQAPTDLVVISVA